MGNPCPSFNEVITLADLNFVPNTAGGSTFRGVDGAASSIIQEVVRVSWGANTAENIVDDITGKRLPVKVGEALPAGTNNIGDVDVLTLPALVAGTANIGDVDVLTLPALVAGAAEIGSIRIRGQLDDTATVIPAENGFESVRITAQRGVHANLRDVAGVEIGTAAAPVRVNPTGTTTQPVSGTVTANAGTGTFIVDSELPAAVALADAAANPTVPGVGANLIGFNGTTWDRVRTANTGRLQVDVVTGGGGGTQFAEDAAHVSGDLGTVALGVRRDADTTPVSLDGDYHTLLFDATGNLKVNVKAGAAGGVTHIDDAAFTPATDDVVPIGGFFDDVLPDSVDEGDAGAVRMSANRNLYIRLRDNAGNERGANVSAANELNVLASAQPGVDIGDVDVLTVVTGTGATNLGKAEDAVHATGDTGVYMLAVRDDSPAAHSGTDGDYESLHVNAEGGMWATPTPSASGGLTISRTLSAATTNALSIKTTAGQVYAIYAHNVNAAVRFLKLYNKASAPTVGTDIPVMTLPIPASTTGAGFILNTGGMGIGFSLGIASAITTGVADADIGAVALNEIVVNLLYK